HFTMSEPYIEQDNRGFGDLNVKILLELKKRWGKLLKEGEFEEFCAWWGNALREILWMLFWSCCLKIMCFFVGRFGWIIWCSGRGE
ncbi:hypothetical protein, partial [Cytobacillus oceanisediminis]|uniref:hypothetical protein n=1 Tax=Cytobacillus oceanisediminis TaxID=665099 RepID=UPI001C92C4B3